MGRLLDVFYLTRPVLVAVVWIFPLVGARGLAAGDRRLAWLLLECAGLAGAAFVANQLADRDSDRVNGKCETLARGLAGGREAVVLAAVMAAAGLGAAWQLGVGHLAAAVLFLLASAVAYNLWPLRAKDRPVLAPLLAAPAYLLLAGQGAVLAGWQGPALVGRVLPVTLAGLSLSLLATVPDAPGDRRAGKRTWTVAYGEAAAWRVALLLMGAAAVAALSAGDIQVTLPATAAAALMVRGQSRRPAGAAAVAVLRAAVAAMALALAWSWPWICLGVAVFLAASRCYYRRRFGIDYPALGADSPRGLDPGTT